jgi:hypothetical protein
VETARVAAAATAVAWAAVETARVAAAAIAVKAAARIAVAPGMRHSRLAKRLSELRHSLTSQLR